MRFLSYPERPNDEMLFLFAGHFVVVERPVSLSHAQVSVECNGHTIDSCRLNYCPARFKLPPLILQFNVPHHFSIHFIQNANNN